VLMLQFNVVTIMNSSFGMPVNVTWSLSSQGTRKSFLRYVIEMLSK
jgi:hypothetical protein